MEVTYRKNLGRSYMCIEEEGELIEPYELRMLESRRIPCLLQMQTVISEGNIRYLYDISGKQQITDYFSGKKMGYDFLQKLLFSVYEVCGSLPEYLLREEGVCLREELIYVNLEDGSLQFTYLPFYEKNLPEAFRSCMEQILRKIDHQDSAAVELGYQAYQLSIKENINISRMLGSILGKPELCGITDAAGTYGNSVRKREEDHKTPKDDVEEQRGREVRDIKGWESGKKAVNKGTGEREAGGGKNGRNSRDNTEGAGKKTIWEEMRELWDRWKGSLHMTGTVQKYVSGLSAVFMQKYRKKESAEERVPEMPEPDAVREEDVPIHPTEFLGVRENVPIGKLVYHGIHQCEDILIKGEVCLVGKNAGQVDGVIPAEGVSRLHARITRQEGSYFIEDLNSTNGTYLNDMMLEYHQPKPLNIRDKVRFGVEEYVFL